jgi:hypothetical protein
MMAPPSSGSLLRWISHQRAMSCRTRLRVDCDLGTLPVNVRTSRAPSLSMIRQCRKAKSKGSSFFSEKSTLKVDLGLVSVILPPHCVRPRGQSITRTGVPSVLCTPFWSRRTPHSRLSFLPGFRPCAYPRILTNLPPGSVIALVFCPGFPAVSLRRRPFGFCGSLHPFPVLGKQD